MAYSMKQQALLLLCAMALLITLGLPAAHSAVSCGSVNGNIAQCLSYVTGKAPAVSSGCCAGIRTLAAAAKTSTPADRQAACSCIKSAASRISGVNPGLAAGLPGKCGVSVPYSIGPNTDCSRIG